MTIYQYTDYRLFLKEFYVAQKAADPKFTFRKFSQLVGVKAPNYINLLIDGRRNLSEKTIEKFTKLLGFNAGEASYFRNLVKLNQAQTTEEKKAYAEQLVRSSGFKRFHPLAEPQYRLLSRWYYFAIFEMIHSPFFKEDADWIASSLRPKVSVGDVKRALLELESLGLVKRASDGRLKQSESNIETDDEVVNLAVLHYHRELIMMAAESLDRFAGQARDITGLTFSLNSEDVPRVKSLLQRFRKEMAEAVSDAKNADRVYQINFQFFPIAILD